MQKIATNTSVNIKRPRSIIIVSVLTLIAVMPPMIEVLAGMFSREIAFAYPPRPIIEPFIYFLIDIPLLLVCIISGIGLFKRQRWSWFVAIGLHVVVFSVHVAACITVGPDATGRGFIGSFDGSYGRYASISISLISLYFLSRKDVRNHLSKSQ